MLRRRKLRLNSPPADSSAGVRAQGALLFLRQRIPSMFQAFKLWQLASALKSKGNSQDAFEWKSLARTDLHLYGMAVDLCAHGSNDHNRPDLIYAVS